MSRVLVDKWTTRATNGIVSKAIYKSEDGKLLFVKGNSEYGSKEPLSEYLASKLFKLFLPTVDYSLDDADKYPDIVVKRYDFVSVCEKLPYNITPLCRQVEYDIEHTWADEEDIINFINEEKLNKEHLIRVLILDALIGNTDRHWNNFDIRNNNGVLVWAPALDFGASLLSNIEDYELSDDLVKLPDSSKPFADNHVENIEVAFKMLEVKDKEILRNVSKTEVMNTLQDSLERVPENACSMLRKDSIIKYVSERYDKYILPYTRIGGRFIK